MEVLIHHPEMIGHMMKHTEMCCKHTERMWEQGNRRQDENDESGTEEDSTYDTDADDTDYLQICFDNQG